MSRTVLYDLPLDIRGFVREDADGEITYVINSRLTREANIETFLHEMKHTENNDLRANCNVNEVECERHK
jgi:acylphosphatase